MYLLTTSRRLLAGLLMVLFFSLAAPAKASFENTSEDPSPLAKCWSYQGSADLSVSAASDGSNIYYLDTDRRLHAVDMSLGAKLWSTDVGGVIASGLHVSGTSVFLVTGPGEGSGDDNRIGRLRSISTQSGITNWVSEIHLSDRVSIGTLNGTVVAATAAGAILAFVRESGAAAWSKDLGVALASQPMFGQGALTVVTVNNEVLRIGERADVSRLARLDHAPTALISRSGSGTLVGDDRGNLVFLSAGYKRVWTFKNGARISHILPFDSEYIVVSDDNFIYKLSRSGGVEWKRRLSGRTAGKPLLTGNSFVASVVGEGDVYVIDARNGKVLNRIEMGDGISAEISSAEDQKGFTVLHPDGLVRYSDACGA